MFRQAQHPFLFTGGEQLRVSHLVYSHGLFLLEAWENPSNSFSCLLVALVGPFSHHLHRLWLPCHCWLCRCLRLPHSHLVLPRLFLPWLVLPRFILRLPSHVQWPSTRGMSVTATSAPQPPSSTRSASGPAPFLDYGALDPRVDPQNCFGLSVLSHG